MRQQISAPPSASTVGLSHRYSMYFRLQACRILAKRCNKENNCSETSKGPVFSQKGFTMKFILNLLIQLPARIASHFVGLGPLIMRLVVGYTFMLSG